MSFISQMDLEVTKYVSDDSKWPVDPLVGRLAP